jgi:RNA polymerase sigma-70 factor, ECF subfamily
MNGLSVGGPPDRDTRDAFREHVTPQIDVLLRVAGRLTHDPADAEDLVQETLLRAYRAIGRFDGRHPRAWLLTILRNTWKNSLRKRLPTPIDDELGSLSAQRARGADGRRGAEETVLADQLDPDLARALAGLSPKMRSVVLLVDVDGLSYQEAADTLDIPEGTVMSRLHRARKKLRHQLEEAGFTAGGPR